MESLQEILDLVFEKLQDSMNPTAYAAWIKGIEPLKWRGQLFTCRCRPSLSVIRL